jgi:HNH endonuclease/AP2 domain
MADSTCSVEDCGGKPIARGWCRKHYQRWYATGDVADRTPQPAVMCSIEGCERRVLARGWCRNHYYRWYNLGDPLRSKPRECEPVETRLWSKVDMSGGPDSCWPWTGTLDGKGYGRFRLNSQTGRKAHRVAYELATGDELGNLQIDHTCFNRSCCNPAHLRPATNKQNQENHRGPRANSRSGSRGVTLRPSGRWVARVGNNYQQITVGTFDTESEAAEAARLARIKLHTYNDFDRE